MAYDPRYPQYSGGPVRPNPVVNMAPRPPKKKGGKGLTIAAVLLLVVGIALIALSLAIWLPHQRNYEAVHNVSVQAAQDVTEGTQTTVPTVDFTALRLINPEIQGWVQIPDTVVNYAVAQHADNDFYLDHALDQSYNPYGTVFLDYRCSPYALDYTTVVYGHHLQNGEEFAKIADYSDQAEFDTLDHIFYVTPNGVVHDLAALSCMVVNGYDVESVRAGDFVDDADFQAYVQSTINRSSAVTSRPIVGAITHLYIFSTCSYAQENDRTVLVCVDRSVLGLASLSDSAQAGEASQIQAAADAAAADQAGG